MPIIAEGDIPQKFFLDAVHAGVCGIDTETSGLDFSKDTLALVQISIPGKETILLRKFQRVPNNFISLMEHTGIRKIFHYALFDLSFLINTFQVYPVNIRCTKIASKLLDRDRTRFYDTRTQHVSHSLRTLLWYYFGIDIPKGQALSNWFADKLTDEQIQYAEEDVIYLDMLETKMILDLCAVGYIHIYREACKQLPSKAYLKVHGWDDLGLFGY